MNIAIYPRKSKADDNSDSMDTQIAMCKEYIERNYKDYTITIYGGDYGISGHSIKKRKDFQRMMKDIQNGLIQLVVIQRYDRIARNVRDFCNLFYEMERNNCDLVSVSQQIDTTTPYGKNFMIQQAAMAELEWALNSERRKDVNRHAATIGRCTLAPHLIPIGYTTERRDGIIRMVKDAKQEEIAKEVFRYFAIYRNYTATARHINELYGLTTQNGTIRSMINNRLYMGEYRGNKAYCEPYLTEEEWNELQKKKPQIRNKKKHKKESWFVGLVKCPVCGRNLRAQAKTKPSNGRTFKYLVCQYRNQGLCTNNHIKSELLIEDMALALIEQEMGDSTVSGKAEPQKPKTDNAEKQIKQLENELERLNIIFQKGRIDVDKYDAEYLRIENEITILRRATTSQGHSNKAKATFTGNWKDMYHALSDTGKKLFWRQTVEQIILNEKMEVTGVIFK